MIVECKTKKAVLAALKNGQTPKIIGVIAANDNGVGA